MSSSPSQPVSPTQRDLGETEIARYVRDAFGPDAKAVAVAPLSGGGFASVTRIDLADGRSVVLKVARLHAITGEHYGYDGGRACGQTWREAYAAVIESLLEDAVEWNVSLVVPPERIRAAVARSSGVLDEVDRPALLHFDLWDGNALCAADANGRWGLAGLVDGERFLFGDPLLDFVSPALFRRIEEEPGHPFVAGYAAVSGRPTTFTEAERRTLELYRLHLYLLMTVEMPSRGMTRENQTWRFDHLEALLRECVEAVEAVDVAEAAEASDAR